MKVREVFVSLSIQRKLFLLLLIVFAPVFAVVARTGLVSLIFTLLAGVCLFWILANLLIVRPIGKLAAATERLDEGQFDARTGAILESNQIERKAARAALEQGCGGLEARINKRTAELMNANRALTAEIREREAAVEEIHESEARIRAITDTSLDAILMMDPDGLVTFWNPAAERMLGYAREEALGRDLHLLIAPKRHHEAYDAAFPKFRLTGQGDAVGKTLDLSACRKDGKEITVSLSLSALNIQGGWHAVGVLRDVTEQKLAELELLKLRRCVENSYATIVITDKDGAVEYANPAFTQTTGYSQEEVLGQNPRVLKSGMHDEAFYRGMWETLSEGNTWRGEICNRKKNGELYWESATISPVRGEDGAIHNYVAIKDDISDKKDLERIKEDVERIMRHDLKTPLNAIIGFPELLSLADNLTDEQQELVKGILDSGNRMLHMINRSLDLFKMETAKYEYIPTAVDALSVIGQLAEHSRSKISAKHLTLSIIVDGDSPAHRQSFTVASEERLLYTLLSNLLLNAIEASPKGETIVVELTNTSPKRIAIRNTGTVPVEIRHDFFSKYKTQGKKSGTGLGTYSAKLYADTMGYELHMTTSDEENTTRVTVSIPAMEQHETAL